MLDVILCSTMRCDEVQVQVQSVQGVGGELACFGGLGRAVCEKKVVRSKRDDGEEVER